MNARALQRIPIVRAVDGEPMSTLELPTRHMIGVGHTLRTLQHQGYPNAETAELLGHVGEQMVSAALIRMRGDSRETPAMAARGDVTQGSTEAPAPLPPVVGTSEPRDAAGSLRDGAAGNGHLSQMIDASDGMRQMEAALMAADSACQGNPASMLAAFVGAIATVAANSPNSENLLRVAMDALDVARRAVTGGLRKAPAS